MTWNLALIKYISFYTAKKFMKKIYKTYKAKDLVLLRKKKLKNQENHKPKKTNNSAQT